MLCIHSCPSSMFCNLLTEAELINHKTAGPESRHYWPSVAPAIIQPFLHIINLCFSTGVFFWQLARVYQKVDRFITQSHRPISLLSLFHTLQKFMVKKVSNSLTNNSVLYTHQFTFRQKCSTVLTLIDVVDDTATWRIRMLSRASRFSKSLWYGWSFYPAVEA